MNNNNAINAVGENIPLNEAALLTAEHRAKNPTAAQAHLFGKNIINEILCQEGAAGIRIYNGITPGTNDQKLVLVGVDDEGNDIIPGISADRSIVCPPMCSNPSPLNGQ